MSLRPDAITLKQLRLFTAVVQHGNLGEAASVLCITRAAVSQGLQELELRMARPLFDRIKKRMVINENGQRLLPVALEMLERLESVQNLFSENTVDYGHLSIGASNTIGNYLLPGMLASWLDQGQVTLPSVVIENTTQLADLLENHALDIALVEGDLERESLARVKWRCDQMCVVAASDFNVPVKASTFSLKRLSQYPWIVREQGSGSRRYFDAKVAPLLNQPRVRLAMNANEAVLNAIAAGIGIGLLSRFSIQDSLAAGRVKILNTLETFERDYYVMWHKKRYQSASLLHLLKAVQADNHPL